MMQSTLALGLREDHMSGELLKRAIERRGFKKKHIAERKGITPSTLARQLSGKHSLTLRDLREYTEILQCEFEELVVDLTPVKILGEVVDVSSVKLFDQTQKEETIFPPHQLPSSIVALRYRTNQTFSLYLFDQKHMQLQTVDPSCFKQLCFYKVTDAQMTKNINDDVAIKWQSPYGLGYIYPEPEGLYTIQSIVAGGLQTTNQQLTFAAPLVARYYDPLTLGWQYVTK